MTTTATPAGEQANTKPASTDDSGKTAEQIAAETAAATAAAAASAAGTKTPEQLAAETAAATAAATATTDAQRTAAALAAKAAETFALAIPTGAETYLDATDLVQIEAQARARGLTAADAQRALEEHVDRLVAQSAAFRAETDADATYGGDHLSETQQHATRVLDRFAPVGAPLHDRLRGLLAKNGMGNELSVVSFLARIGKAMAEDPVVAGRAAGGTARKPDAEVMFPSAGASS